MADGAIYDSEQRKILMKVVKIDTAEFKVPSSVEEIRGGTTRYDSAFYPCAQRIKKVTFEAGSLLNTVGTLLFSYTSLCSIDMTPCTHLTQLSEAFFYKCDNLVDVKLPPVLVTIPIGCFSGCTSLPSLDIPDSVEKIEEWTENYVGVFDSTTNLTRIIFGEKSSLTRLGSHAFMKSGITFISLPKSLNSIGSAPFIWSKLETIQIHADNPKYQTDGHVITSGNLIVTIAPCYSGVYNIPENAEFSSNTFRGSHITEYKFLANKNYTLAIYCFSSITASTVNLPNLIETIPENCFSESLIETITLPTSLLTIKSEAFRLCRKLRQVVFPESLKTIIDRVFSDCVDLTRVEIPYNVEEYGQAVFANCDPNLEIIFLNKERFVTTNNLVILNGQKAVEYIGKDPNFEVIFPSSCTFIGNDLFAHKSLKKVTFSTPGTVTSFGERSFLSSTIQEISFPSGITTIGKDCFQYCKHLTSVVISGTLTTIPSFCFNDCNLLQTVTLKTDTIERIDEYAFNGTKMLSSFEFNSLNLVTIGYQAFRYSGIHRVALPSTVKFIGNQAFRESSVTEFIGNSLLDNLSPYLFYNAEMLSSVEIGSAVKTIDTHCFRGCASLQNVALCPATEVIGMYAFSNCTSLTYITIPQGSMLITIEPFAFDGSMNFNSFDILDNEKFSFDKSCLMDRDRTKIIYYIQESRSRTCIVPGTVKKIGVYSFNSCKYLKEIIIADGTVNEIGANAFDSCINLKRLVLPKSITTIGLDAFKNCIGLECGSVTIEEKLIEQAKAARINEVALQKDCITKDNYIQFGVHTCVYKSYSVGKVATLLFTIFILKA